MKSYSRKAKSSSSKTIALVAGGALGTLFVSGAALAITESSYNYTTPKTGYYGISNLGLAPRNHSNEYDNPGMSGGLSGTGCFHRGVNLPQGAVITGLTVYYAGTDEDDVIVTLTRQRLSDGNQQNIASKSMSDVSTNRVSETVPITASRATIANAGYNYGFQVCVDPGGAFFGARITYTYTSAGD